jgi:hypothetical protein
MQINPNIYRKQYQCRFKTEPTPRHRGTPSFLLLEQQLLDVVASSRGGQMIRKLASGQYRLYSKKKDKSGKRKNLGTFKSLAAAKKHERAVQFFKRA